VRDPLRRKFRLDPSVGEEGDIRADVRSQDVACVTEPRLAGGGEERREEPAIVPMISNYPRVRGGGCEVA